MCKGWERGVFSVQWYMHYATIFPHMFMYDVFPQRRRRQHQLRLLRARMHNILRTFGTNNRIAAYRLGRFNAANVELVDDFCRELVRQETGVMPSPFINRSASPQVRCRHVLFIERAFVILAQQLLVNGSNTCHELANYEVYQIDNTCCD